MRKHLWLWIWVAIGTLAHSVHAAQENNPILRSPDRTAIEDASARLAALEFKVKHGRSLFKQDAYFAGTDQERADELNRMFADKSVKAIVELRGGYGANRILDYLGYDLRSYLSSS